MGDSRPFSAGSGAGTSPDPRLKPTPDYGTLGPGSDAAGFGAGPAQAPARRSPSRGGQLLAVAIGITAALVFGRMGSAGSAWRDFGKVLSNPQNQPLSAQDSRQIDRLKPQKQAETLLEQAVAHSAGAVDQISSRVDRWQGKVQWSPQIATLTTAALNSNDMRVRESGIEVELAAYGLAKNSASLEYLLKTAKSPDHAQKIWALWALGLIANRGVEAERVVGTLTVHLQDTDVDSRKWAVEGLALAGTDQSASTLLKTLHDDASPAVRERAACGIAESGMFTPEQRMAAVPQLLNYADDPALDAQTHAWAFQALGDITHQRLPNDSGAWRIWYEAAK
ncbi:MAG: HEAT repeat domain-containing protein [Candidatus Sulfotelmatobacter sp.]